MSTIGSTWRQKLSQTLVMMNHTKINVSFFSSQTVLVLCRSAEIVAERFRMATDRCLDFNERCYDAENDFECHRITMKTLTGPYIAVVKPC